MDYVDTFERRFGGLSHSDVAAQNAASTGDLAMPTGNEREAPSPCAFVDGSRWMASCPADGCNGAERVNFSTGLFYCCSCRNEDWGHDYLRVTVPDAETRFLVEAVLLDRPSRFRAWMPGQSVDDLVAENKEHGL